MRCADGLLVKLRERFGLGPVVEQQVLSASQWLVEELDLDAGQLLSVVLEAPGVLGLDVSKQLKPKVPLWICLSQS